MSVTDFATTLFTGKDLVAIAALRYEDGVVGAVLSDQPPRPGPRRLIIPALVNAHDHARPSATSFGASNMPLETWILRSVLGTPPDPYLAAAVALARTARAGWLFTRLFAAAPGSGAAVIRPLAAPLSGPP